MIGRGLGVQRWLAPSLMARYRLYSLQWFVHVHVHVKRRTSAVHVDVYVTSVVRDHPPNFPTSGSHFIAPIARHSES